MTNKQTKKELRDLVKQCVGVLDLIYKNDGVMDTTSILMYQREILKRLGQIK